MRNILSRSLINGYFFFWDSLRYSNESDQLLHCIPFYWQPKNLLIFIFSKNNDFWSRALLKVSPLPLHF